MSNGEVTYNETAECGKYVTIQLVARQGMIKRRKGKKMDRVLEYKKKSLERRYSPK